MQISRTSDDGLLHLTVAGRLDGFWADHLDAALAEEVREGHHHLRLDLSQVTFLSSAGIAALMKFYKQLGRISGSLAIVNPSAPVRAVLDMARLSTLLITSAGAAAAERASISSGISVSHRGVRFQLLELNSRAVLQCRRLGDDAPLRTGAFTPDHCMSLGSMSPVLAVGVGAFGAGYDDCRDRFGELLSVAGATGYQPADGSNVADYLVSDGPLTDDVRVLYGMACEGEFSRMLRFDSPIGLRALAEACLGFAGGMAAGFVMIGEAAGLVGAALRRSPVSPVDDFFAHPGIRQRLTFTAERAYLRTLTLVTGILAREDLARSWPQLRPMGGDGLYGHVHAAAFPYRPLKKGEMDLKDTVRSLFEHEALLGVLHLLHDDRGSAGAGESEFIRGVCWIGSLADDVLPPAGG